MTHQPPASEVQALANSPGLRLHYCRRDPRGIRRDYSVTGGTQELYYDSLGEVWDDLILLRDLKEREHKK